MKTTWIVVANRTNAWFLRSTKSLAKPEIVEHLDHPNGRLHDGDFVTDQQGMIQEGPGAVMQRFEPKETPSEHDAVIFTRQTIGALSKHATQEDRIVLIADPAHLGRLKAELPTPLQRALAGTVTKDIAQHPRERILREVTDWLTQDQQASA